MDFVRLTQLNFGLNFQIDEVDHIVVSSVRRCCCLSGAEAYFEQPAATPDTVQEDQSWSKVTLGPPSNRSLTEGTIRVQLGRMTSLLHDDTRATVPHLCLAFASSHQVYSNIGEIAIKVGKEPIVLEAVTFFSTLVDSDEEDLLQDANFSQTLMVFVDSLLGLPSSSLSLDIRGEVLELLFGVAAKVRVDPEILPAWFHTIDRYPSSSLDGSVRPDLHDTKRRGAADFPLCRRFVSHVYYEGRVGDFARTGLLYIFESASESTHLESWLIASDVTALLATGLGALYSQLNRKLSFGHPPSAAPLILALSDTYCERLDATAESFHTVALQAQLTAFLSYLQFWQDMLQHCRSTDLKSTLVHQFQTYFLQQILYPSLLESSDVDGGSSIAVQTYLWRILEAVNDPDLVKLILDYLMGKEDGSEDLNATAPRTAPPTITRPHRDLSIGPSFFNLSDLIIANISSHNHETKCAALRTLSILVSHHHCYTSSALLFPKYANSPIPKSQAHPFENEVSEILVLAQKIGPLEGLDESYEACLEDALALLETHVCGKGCQGNLSPANMYPAAKSSRRLEQCQENNRAACLDLSNPLVNTLCRLMEQFLYNEPEVNLGLTNVFMQLLACLNVDLEGFVVGEVTTIVGTGMTAEVARTKSRMLHKHDVKRRDTHETTAPDNSEAATSEKEESRAVPTMRKILAGLTAQIELLRQSIPDLQNLIANRKTALLDTNSVQSPRSPPTEAVSQQQNQSNARHGQIEGRSHIQTPTKNVGASTSQLGDSALSTYPPNSSPGPGNGKTDTATGSTDPQLRVSTSGGRLALPLSSLGTYSQNVSMRDLLDSRAAGRRESALIKNQAENLARRIPLFASSDSPKGQAPVVGTLGDRDPTRSVHHVLTNVVILQEFVLEVAAVMQMRAGF